MLAIRDTVKATGDAGAPSGHVYAILMTHGCSLDQYQQIIQVMTAQGMIQQRGHVLYAD